MGTIGKALTAGAAIATGAVVVGSIEESILSALNSPSNLNAFLTSGSSLYFPSDLGSTKHPFYISFSFRKFERRSIYDRPFLKDIGMIRLPPPNQLVDSNDADYSTQELGAFVGAGLEYAVRAVNGSSSIADKAVAVAQAGAALGTGSALTAMQNSSLAAKRVSDALGGVSSAALSLGGVAINPFLTVLFKAPRFKRHKFTWTLNPTNASESEIIRNLVNKFKYHQLPDITSAPAGSLLTYPDIVEVGLYPNNYYLYDFKPCVIESFTAIYSTEGQPAYFSKTNAPVTVTIDLSLLEIEYFLKNDILNPTYKTMR